MTHHQNEESIEVDTALLHNLWTLVICNECHTRHKMFFRLKKKISLLVLSVEQNPKNMLHYLMRLKTVFCESSCTSSQKKKDWDVLLSLLAKKNVKEICV